jgi:inosine-uridine nucleoside N-ribohydrolase
MEKVIFLESSETLIKEPIPVILDTDIGTDIDDTWALGLLLKCSELKPILITTATGDTEYRAKIVAKFLQKANYHHIPIGIGPSQHKKGGQQTAWVMDYNLQEYPGEIYKDGVQAIIDKILKSPIPVTIIAIGPLTNIALAIKREPKIILNSRFIGMQGAIYIGYNKHTKSLAEYNVVQDIKAAQQVFSMPWVKTITPLDTCGNIILEGEDYQKILKSEQIIPKLILENYEIWAWPKQITQYPIKSSVLYDTVAIYLAITTENIELEELGIAIDRKGRMKINKKIPVTKCAVRWQNQAQYHTWLVNRLLS